MEGARCIENVEATHGRRKWSGTAGKGGGSVSRESTPSAVMVRLWSLLILAMNPYSWGSSA